MAIGERISWPRIRKGEVADLLIWRDGFSRLMLAYGAIIFPLSMIYILPVFITEKRYGLFAIDAACWLFMISQLFSFKLPSRVKAPLTLGMIYVMSITFIISLGPFGARPAWLLMCTVFSGILFGMRGAMASSLFNLAILWACHSLVGPGNKAWAPIYAEPVGNWIVFSLNTSLLALASGLAVGFLLDRLDRSLREQLDATGTLRKSSKELKNAYELLKGEVEQRKSAEKALIQKEAQYRLLAENATDIIFTTDMELNVTYISPSVYQTRGYTQQEIKELKLTDHLTPNSLALASRVLAEELVAEAREDKDLKRSRTLEVEIIRKDRSTSWSEMNLTFIRDPEGRAVGILGVSRDVTDRKRAGEDLRASEERFRQLSTAAFEGIAISDQGVVLDGNPQLAAILGCDLDEMIGRPVMDFIAPESLELVKEHTRSGYEGRYEHFMRRKDGSIFPAEAQGRAMPWKDRMVRVTALRDITDQKRMEEERRAGEDKFAKAFHYSPIAMSISTLKESRYLDVNAELIQMTEWSREEMIGHTGLELGIWVEPNQQAAILERLREQGFVHNEEHPIRTKTGKVLTVLLSYQNIVVNDEPCVLLSGIDITARKQMEEALRENESRYRNVIENIQDIFYRTDKDGIVIMASPSAVYFLGYDSLDEIIGKSISNFWKEPQRQAELIRRVRAEGPVTDYEVTAKKKDGSLLLVSTSCAFYRDETGKVLGIEGIIRDITQRKRAEEALRESEERYRALAEGTSEAVLLRNSDGRIVYTNPAAVTLLHAAKTEDLLGHNYLDFVHPDDREESAIRISRTLTEGLPALRREHRLIALAGQVVQVESTGLPLIHQGQQHILGVFHDITERKKSEKEKNALQAQLQQAQKMEAIGTLAGGIAHDFNNILAAIMGYAELAGLDIPEGCKARHNLDQSMKSAHRAKDLVQQILSFSRQGKQERKPLDIGPITKEVLKLLRASLPATIEIRQEIEKGLGTIKADPTQIHQVLMNLCTNAGHAMGDHGGVLEVSLNKVTLTAGESARLAEIEPGPYVRLRVRDTGQGIPSEVLKRIFDPYFTTKAPGKGTGLGLAVVHGIVKSYGGGIGVSSEVGKGSTFDIYFPWENEVGALSETEKADPLLLGGGERLLFVDDEQAIVEVSREILEHLGYEVVVRTSSVEALELIKKTPDWFDLLVTDMTMPNMTGDRLAKEVLEVRPELPIILCTGFSEHISAERAKALGIREFVLKPLVIRELAQAIRWALDPRKKKKG
jgi:PAS domain S-box-containing protein